MNTLSARDSLFSELHATVLKPVGYRKRGHWSTREEGGIVQSVYLRASRFGDSSKAIFWVDLQVFSPAWYELVFAPKVFPGVKESTAALITEDLGRFCDPPMHTFQILPTTSLEALRDCLFRALERALPILSKCATLEDILGYYKTATNPNVHAFSAAGVCLLLNRFEEAKQHMADAKRLAPHENFRQWLIEREIAMGLNSKL